jgi:hypothetical protein
MNKMIRSLTPMRGVKLIKNSVEEVAGISQGVKKSFGSAADSLSHRSGEPHLCDHHGHTRHNASELGQLEGMARGPEEVRAKVVDDLGSEVSEVWPKAWRNVEIAEQAQDFGRSAASQSQSAAEDVVQATKRATDNYQQNGAPSYLEQAKEKVSEVAHNVGDTIKNVMR